MPFTQVNIRPNGLFAGVASDNTKNECDAYVNEEASQEAPFGTVLVQGTAERGAKVFASNANKMLGILRNQFAYAVGTDLGLIGLKPKATLSIARRGRLTVIVGEAVTPSSPVRVRQDTNAGALGTNLGPGTFCTTASAGHTAKLPFCKFEGTTTGPGVVEISFDFTSRDLAVND